MENSDGFKYAQVFASQSNYTITQYINDISNIYKSGTGYPDIYAFSLFFWLGLFTNNPQIFHLVTAAVYFTVMVNLVGSVYDTSSKGTSKPVIWFLIGLIFVINLSSGMNGVRWPLAMMLFLFGSFKVVTTGKIKYMFLAGATIFVHFILLYAFIFLLFYYFTYKYYNPIYAYIFLIVVLLATTFLTQFIQQNAFVFGEAYEEKIIGFATNESYKASREDHLIDLHWYIQFDRYSTYFFAAFSLILIALLKRKFKFNQTAKQLEYFAFLMLGASVISGALVDVTSNRYYLLANATTLIFLYYLSSINSKNKIFTWLKVIYIPIVILHIFIMFRSDLYTISPFLVFGNPILILFLDTKDSIQSIITG